MWKRIIPSSQQACALTRNQALPVTTKAQRSLSTTTPRYQKNKPSSATEDRGRLSPERTEVSKSGTDSEVAQHPAAYDPSKTAPETELKATGEEHEREGKSGNPLDMSPANQDVSAWRGQTEGGAAHNAEKSGPSSRGQPRKNRKIEVKEDGTHVSHR
ncbi:hypothetical protein N7474_002844 [Penicillium riverlandense]|uniref:uncharacterized protein n=1 Tax=Penicillium riverlandense TaxID=1903569 RepID=UPI00254860EF|nr:uncharacterized protein N7474_002844 [Penicillium riverlandense]KAJ5825706.1 hypothetical protein N7474_002844 [Penicillium riverlandense]